uniref:EF-hand domain-containing protein n=1 Tax=Anopheles merus TaxID=30066 RepID=A0A182UXH9_ANOME
AHALFFFSADLRTAFDLLDRDQDGHVTPEELQFMLRNLGIHVRDELIDDLLREASRTAHLASLRRDWVFDRDGNGYITRDELKSAMDMIGENVTEYQLNEMLELADADKDGRINYEDFQNFFLNNFDALVQPPKK